MDLINLNNLNPQGQNFNGLILDGVLLNNARGRLGSPSPRSGIQLFNGSPGRLFGNNEKFYFNSGTSNNGAYIPPFNFSGGKGNIIGLEAAPPNISADAEQGKAELDLISNGDGTFKRNGFNGTYKVRSDGGIEFSGGFHGNRGNRINCPPQVYFAGKGWFKLGNASASSGLGGVVNSGTDVFTPNQGLGGNISAAGNISVAGSGDVFSSISSMGENQPASNQIRKRIDLLRNADPLAGLQIPKINIKPLIDKIKSGGKLEAPSVEEMKKNLGKAYASYSGLTRAIGEHVEKTVKAGNKEELNTVFHLLDYLGDYGDNLADADLLSNEVNAKPKEKVDFPVVSDTVSKLKNKEKVNPPSVTDIRKDFNGTRKNLDEFRNILKNTTDDHLRYEIYKFVMSYEDNVGVVLGEKLQAISNPNKPPLKSLNEVIQKLRDGEEVEAPRPEDLRNNWNAHRDNHLVISKEITKFLAELNNQEKTPENIKLASALFDYHSDYMASLEDALALNFPQFFKKTGDIKLPDPNEVLSKLQNGEDVSPPSVSDIAKDRASVRKNMDNFREVLKGITDGASFNKFVGFYQQYVKNYLTARDAELTKFNSAQKNSAFPKELEIELPLNGQPPQQGSTQDTQQSTPSNSTNQPAGKVDKQSLEKKINSYLAPISTGLHSRNSSLLNFSMSKYNTTGELQSLLSQLEILGQTYKPGDAQQGNYDSALRDLRTLIEEKKAEESNSAQASPPSTPPDPNDPEDLLEPSTPKPTTSTPSPSVKPNSTSKPATSTTAPPTPAPAAEAEKKILDSLKKNLDPALINAIKENIVNITNLGEGTSLKIGTKGAASIWNPNANPNTTILTKPTYVQKINGDIYYNTAGSDLWQSVNNDSNYVVVKSEPLLAKPLGIIGLPGEKVGFIAIDKNGNNHIYEGETFPKKLKPNKQGLYPIKMPDGKEVTIGVVSENTVDKIQYKDGVFLRGSGPLLYHRREVKDGDRTYYYSSDNPSGKEKLVGEQLKGTVWSPSGKKLDE